MPRSLVLIFPVLLLAVATQAAEPADPQGFFPAGHHWEGLPVQASSTVYDAHPEHPLNRLHRLLFVRHLVPEEIHAQLPAERERQGTTDAEFFQQGWYFQKRSGAADDARLFGGDVRVSPVRELTAADQDELKELLAQLATPEAVAQLEPLGDSLTRLLVQWDLLVSWWRLENGDRPDQELLEALARAIAALAQTPEQLAMLPSGLEDLRQHYAGGTPRERNRPYLPRDFDIRGDSAWVEVGRRSSPLFHADRSLRASHTFLNVGDRTAAEQLVQAAADTAALPTPPAGAQTALVQTLMAIDTELQPVATPVIDELRIRIAQEPYQLAHDHPSSSRDGSSHWIYLRTRHGSRTPQAADFRFVPDSAQAIFVEYGTLKHATFAAQCALCHRLTHSGNQAPLGIKILSRYAEPHLAAPEERRLLAVEQMQPVAERLRERLAAAKAASPVQSEPAVSRGADPQQEQAVLAAVTAATEQPLQDNGDQAATTTPSRLPPRPLKSPQELADLAATLRAVYSAPPQEWPQPTVDAGVEWREIGLLPSVEHPADNPYSLAKETLGKTLFFDPRLSGSQQLACASCHDPDLGWADGRTASFGHSREPLVRNAPTIRNVAYQSSLFWDGRAKSLEDQAQQVLLNPAEMHAEPSHIEQIVANEPGYQTLFCEAFGDEKVTFERVAMAIACFERTIVSGRSRFDAFLKGNSKALSDAAVRGLDLFRRDARCMNCHHGPAFTDSQFHDLGLSYYGRKYQDLGRYELTGEAEDVGRFRTPSLRDVTSTMPLMHNGLFELTGVLNMYNAGMATLRRKPHQQTDPLFPTKSPLLRPLQLNQQDLADLAAFIESLEEPRLRIRQPALPGLHPEFLEARANQP